MAKNSKTMLNKSGESGQPCLVPDLSGNAFSFSPLRTMLAVGLSYMAFIMLRKVPSMPTFCRVLAYIYNGILAIKRNEIELFVVRWMDLESVIQGEVIQKEKK